MFFAFVVGILTMLTSCNKDEISSSDSKLVNVTFNLKTPTDTRIGGCTRFVIEVYEGRYPAGNPVQRIEYGEIAKPLKLTKDKWYTFLCWADYGTPADGANPSIGDYNVTDLKSVSISAPNQQARYEGFYGSRSFQIQIGDKTSTNYSMTLNRAVAKIAYQQSTENFVNDNNVLKVTFPVSYTFNVNGSFLTPTETPYTHVFNNIPQASASAVLGESYIFTSGSIANSELLNLKVTFNSETEKTIANVRARANSRTTIQGPYSNLYKSSINVSNTVSSWTNDDFTVAIEYV